MRSLSIQNLQTNQLRKNSQEQKLLEFWGRLQGSLFENPKINIREVPKMIFSWKIKYLTDFLQIEKKIRVKYSARKMPFYMLRLVAWFDIEILLQNQ